MGNGVYDRNRALFCMEKYKKNGEAHMNTPDIIEIDHLSFQYDGVNVLEDISFSIPKGAFWVSLVQMVLGNQR